MVLGALAHFSCRVEDALKSGDLFQIFQFIELAYIWVAETAADLVDLNLDAVSGSSLAALLDVNFCLIQLLRGGF